MANITVNSNQTCDPSTLTVVDGETVTWTCGSGVASIDTIVFDNVPGFLSSNPTQKPGSTEWEATVGAAASGSDSYNVTITLASGDKISFDPTLQVGQG